jgi:putative photosynthetic complex assembly protein 2
MFWPATVIAITSWWLLTGVALIAVHQPQHRRRAIFVFVSLVMMATWYVIPSNVGDNSPLASAVGFLLGLLIWAWLEISYLLGFVTGPNNKPCPDGASGWQRFIGGLGTTLYHELAVLMMVALLGWISYDSMNTTAINTLIVLWLMRWSAKLNLFFGVRHFNKEWLPNHLGYLFGYIKIERASWFLPFTTLLGIVATVGLYQLAYGATSLSQQMSFYLVGALMLLATIEHLFLLFPFQEEVLWRWASTESDSPKSRTRI